jgi:plasmid stabilization system protein ParE
MRLRYTPHASRQLRAIAEYLAERSPLAARHVGRRIRETGRLLAKFPHLGRDGALPGTREFPVPGLPYILVHRIEPRDADVLTVLAVYHGAQLRPGQGAPEDN